MASTTIERALESQLRDRRRRLARTLAEVGEAPDLMRLLTEVDSALERIGTDAFGRCDVCGEPCTEEELSAHPQTSYCLCDLSPSQRAALQHDLDLAWRVQSALLPAQDLSAEGWQVHFRYQPAGPVSGDYCDVLSGASPAGGVWFLLGDVSGKGVAASFLMAQLNAVVRGLVQQGVSVQELFERANSHLRASSLPSHFVTLVCGMADGSGEVELCNAGHCPPMIVRRRDIELVDSTGLPLGVVDGSTYGTHRVSLAAGDSIVLYTDGITEAPGPSNRRYGAKALARALGASRALSPARIADACLRDVAAFQGGSARADDATLMVVRRM